LSQIITEEGHYCIGFQLDRWRNLPLALQRASIRWAVRKLTREQLDLSFEHIGAAVDIASRGQTGAQATLPGGLTLAVDYDTVILRQATHLEIPDWPTLETGTTVEVAAPSTTLLTGSPWEFEIESYEGPRSGSEWQALLADRWRTPLNGDHLQFPLTLRTRRTGDRFRPMGAGGSQKISTFMVNKKIPARWRDHVSLLTAAHGEIVWVCGWRVDERFAVKEDTGVVWLAKFTRLETLGPENE
jgi:tRNA(Ile)-lysidine synthase